MPTPNEEPTNQDIASALLGDLPSPVESEEVSDVAEVPESAAGEAGEAATGTVEETSDEALAAEAAKSEGDGAEGGAPSPGSGTDEAGSDDPEKVAAEGEEVEGEGEKPQPPARRPVEVGPSKDEVELDRREASYEQRQAAFDAKIKAKLDAGEEYDPYTDGKEERELLREAQAITRERNKLLRQEVAESRQERQVRQHWEGFHEDNPQIAADEGRKKFSEFIRAAAKEYGPDSWSDPSNPSFNVARGVATDRFNQWVKTVKGQRIAKVSQNAPVPKSKQQAKPKTPITPGGGRVTLPPQQGAAGRVPPPIPRTFEERVEAFARRAGATPVDVLMD